MHLSEMKSWNGSLIQNKYADLLIYLSPRVGVFSLKVPFRYFTGCMGFSEQNQLIPRVIIHSFHQTGCSSRMTDESILVVDDEDQLSQFCSILEKGGYSVEPAGPPGGGRSQVYREEAVPVSDHRSEDA